MRVSPTAISQFEVGKHQPSALIVSVTKRKMATLSSSTASPA
jgi:hypothetical protein